ncbi:uncharacterized protein LY79DRAFT_518284 [Colletotrichum navitas]|uniref:Uncharacterized protein n=1 Tax=Colletotrichum navitas TaxID=681940 RepID=A0AAD8V385_9PEZI|nr:uncharacterized protein LY79DRAFT_518284 [Colletotrichum navitas]KAK1585623.1 hypothetical protein LY79DRAFT_518284 [Colletotrichum navitas]
MDPVPVAAPAPAANGADKVAETVATTTSADNKPTESPVAEMKPAEEKKDEKKEATAPVPETSAAPVAEPTKPEEPPALAPPADAPATADATVDAPKPASVEEVPDQDGPTSTGVQEPNATPVEQPAVTSAPTDEPVKASVEAPIAQESAKAPVAEDEPIKEPIIDKTEAVNGDATKGVEMTGALNDAEPAGAGEDEAATQAIPPEPKVGDKRKADDPVETNGVNGANGTNGTNGVGETLKEKPAEKKAKRGPGRPPSNGAAKESPKKEKESLGHKVARNVKKVVHPVGRTARKTRSQGPV